uniref:DM2 domain-containing protein n=1 Tax=Panagrolaimus sp. JU765 TaxID=591449 RepID=A0AC34QLQ1_9BILA
MMRQPAQPPQVNVNMTPVRFNPPQQPPQVPQPGSKRSVQLPPAPGINPMGGGPRPQNTRNRKRRNLDRAIMSEIAEAYPEGKSYVDLLSMEARIDAALLRKRMNIQEALKRPQKMKKKMRVFISHLFIPGREPRENDPGTVPMWELRVEGRLIDECNPTQLELPPSQLTNSANANAQLAARTKRKFSTFFKSLVIELDKDIYGPDNHLLTNSANANAQLAARTKRKFSTFFKSLVIELDKDIYGPDNHLVEWHRAPHTSETDGFQVKRPGDRDVTCTILLSLDYQPMKYKLQPKLAKLLGIALETRPKPMKYKLQPKLAKLLGIALETRPKVIEALWQYIRSHNLQDVKSRDFINCDDMLEQIFMTKRMRFAEIPQRVQSLLTMPDPIVIKHVIRKTDSDKPITSCYDVDVDLDDPLRNVMTQFLATMSGSDKPITSCYDVDVDLDDPLRNVMTQFLATMSGSSEILNLDQKIYDLAEQVSEWKQRVDYYKRFADSPREFLVRWQQSQEADLKNMLAHGEAKGMKNPFPDQPLQAVDRYLQPDMQEGAFRYFYNRICRLRKELEMGINTKNYMC